MKKLALAVCALALIASPALAQDENGGYTIGVGGGMTLPTGDFGDGADPSYTFGGFVTGPLSGMFGWRVEFSYDRFEPSDDLNDLCDALDIDCDQRVLRGSGGIQVNGSGEGMKPYAYGTVGAYNIDVAEGDSDSETKVGVGLGAGINWAAMESMSITFDVGLHGIADALVDADNKESWAWYVTPRAYLTWAF